MYTADIFQSICNFFVKNRYTEVPKLDSVNSESFIFIQYLMTNKDKIILGVDRVEFWNAIQ